MWVRHRVEWITALVAVLLGAGYLLLPPMGSDLAAQVARAGFFTEHGVTPVDLRWYAGVEQFGYSLVSQPVMALLGVRLTGVLTLVAGPVLLAVLFRRTGAARPLLGALLGVAGFAGNLVSGRVTYGLGVCFGLAAVVLLTFPRWRRLAAAPAFLAGATSPVAGLFTGLAGAALILSALPAGGRRLRDGLLLAVPAAVPLAVTALLFGDGGWMNISRTDTLHAVVTGLLVALLVPLRPVRIGALLSSAGVLAAALIHTPVGLNATRLATMFALPVLAAYAALPRTPEWAGGAPGVSRRWRPALALIALIVAVAWWQPMVVPGDVRDIGNSSADEAYFRPLRDRLAAGTLTGRVEIPTTRSYWEAASMGGIPLARGWLRQADIDRNPLFFTTVPGAPGTGVALTPDSYRAWLDNEAVQFVAVPDVELAWPGRTEAEMVTAGLPYLSLVWSDAHWRLYEVADPRPVVAAPATLVRQDGATIVFDAPAAGEVAVRVRHHRWLTASGGATVTADGEWTRVRVPAAGRYTLTSSLI
ncbi:enterotoxin A family protein [Actinoplanes hulinensis]|uniref:Enterotoxin A family protein n=1 Tax=Actinoplanes hulinensis TaxID=1144547 RepID=A0ABS7B7T6_9ACTN|nr:enterotoxin A family protein [Actinoplanes hulinensis]MBW6436744.1 enterotoxin A family protein [Actinoplanes hulinensis]